MKKIRQGRNGLTKSDFLHQEIEREVTLRLDEILDSIAKRKAEAEEEKCYPVPHGDVSTCPKNEQGYCTRFNKKCNNTEEFE